MRRGRWMGRLAAPGLAVVLITACAPPPADDLGTVGGWDSGAEAVAGDGTVVGWSTAENSYRHGFVVPPNGAMVDLGVPGGVVVGPPSAGLAVNFSTADAVNDRGVVVGEVGFDPRQKPINPITVAYRWTAAGGFEVLPGETAPGVRPASAKAVDDAGLIAGLDTQGQPYVWDPATARPTTLPVPMTAAGRPSDYPDVAGITAAGDVVGYVRGADDGQPHGAWWEAATHTLHLLDDTPYGASFALGVSPDGTVVGQVIDVDTQARFGAVWHIDRPDRSVLPAGHLLVAANRAGVAVGYREQAPTLQHIPVRWTAAGGVQDLATPPDGTSMEATAINDGGTIVGVRQQGQHRMAIRFR